MIDLRWARVHELELLVNIRLRDLEMFSKRPIEPQTLQSIREFHARGMAEGTVRTLLAHDGERLVGTGTVYFYWAMPSNENPTGVVAQITSVWVDEGCRRQGIGKRIVESLAEAAFERAGMVCLNSSREGASLYESSGFCRKDNYFVRYKEKL